VLLEPGILLLLARGRVAPALLLLNLQLIPREWSLLWPPGHAAGTLALTIYLCVLAAHWLALLPTGRENPARAPEPRCS